MLSEAIFLEGVPERDREVLRRFPAALHGMRTARSPWTWWLRGETGGFILGVVILCAGASLIPAGVLMAIIASTLGMTDDQAGKFLMGLWLVLSALTAYGTLRRATSNESEFHVQLLARRHHGRYYIPTDFDEVTGRMAE